MKVLVQRPDKSISNENAELRVGGSWQVGGNMGFELDPKTHVQLITDSVYGIDPDRWRPKTETTAVFTSTDWRPVDFRLGSEHNYRANRKDTREQAEELLQINKVAQIESNRMAAKAKPGGLNETLFKWAAGVLLISLALMAIPLSIPAMMHALELDKVTVNNDVR
tara:strand:- start:4836 stop:5333 length:498 start_codon:yes stop_codon:yes gene_type:complete